MHDDPLQPHSHENNSEPPSADSGIVVNTPDGKQHPFTVGDLRKLPQSDLPAYTIATDHGIHGPYRLGGVALLDLVHAVLSAQTGWSQVEVISGDGFGNRIWAHELQQPTAHGPILLCLTSDGQPLSRAHGLVRLIVPSETDNALRQIKWVRSILIA